MVHVDYTYIQWHGANELSHWTSLSHSAIIEISHIMIIILHMERNYEECVVCYFE